MFEAWCTYKKHRTHSLALYTNHYYGSSHRRRWWSRRPFCCTYSPRAWCQCLTSRQARVRLFFSGSLLCYAILFHRFMGGNSTKATSGINGAGTNSQKALNIPDSSKIFFDDTKKSVCLLSLLCLSYRLTSLRLATLLVMTSLKSLLDALEMQ